MNHATTPHDLSKIRVVYAMPTADAVRIRRDDLKACAVERMRACFLAAWEVVRRCFGEHDAPSTLLGVSVLGYSGQLVEVEAVAALR